MRRRGYEIAVGLALWGIVAGRNALAAGHLTTKAATKVAVGEAVRRGYPSETARVLKASSAGLKWGEIVREHPSYGRATCDEACKRVERACARRRCWVVSVVRQTSPPMFGGQMDVFIDDRSGKVAAVAELR